MEGSAGCQPAVSPTASRQRLDSSTRVESFYRAPPRPLFGVPAPNTSAWESPNSGATSSAHVSREARLTTPEADGRPDFEEVTKSPHASFVIRFFILHSSFCLPLGTPPALHFPKLDSIHF